MSGKDFSDNTNDKQDRKSPFSSIHSIAWLIAPVVVLFDRLSKFAVVNYMRPGESFAVVPPIFHLTYVQNTGAAFGLFKGYAWVLLLVSVFVCVYLLLELGKRQYSSISYECSLYLILSGAIGNLIDRARFGYVVDFLDFRVWPVFNIADSSITIGVCLIIWQALRDRKMKDPI